MKAPFEPDEIPYRFIVGIDLGTTNSAVAYVDRDQPETQPRRIQFLDLPQLIAPGETARRPVLPSFLYLPGPYELPPESTALPWDSERHYAVGELAREQGALVPGRLVSSAKSWLCHAGVDRTASILPWGAGADVSKLSPVDASHRYLLHMKESWNHVMARGQEDALLENQCIILTVPASFDEVARELTVAAARSAGLNRVILVEEPLAAFYAWLSHHQDEWQSLMRPGQLILVCDVGGGTTDFTIVAVREGEHGTRFDRLAVGDHLMLGGDNMDLALARHIEIQLFGQPGQLDTRRWHQLWHQCRKAKELLLAEDGEGSSEGPARPAPPKSGSGPLSQLFQNADPSSSPRGTALRDYVDISVVGTGKKLIADTLKARLTREQVKQIILEGFFPKVHLSDHPQVTRRTGLTEWGLPYVQEAAVTRHLAGFWERFHSLLQQETGRTELYPDYLLFNGGALTPASIRERILEVVQGWFQHEAGTDWAPAELENPRPELAVAIGAAYYGLVRLGEGVRVGAGSPRSYYVVVSAEPIVEATDQPESASVQAVCLVPRGTEEGFETELDQPAFEVLTNQPASFQLLSSSTRLGDKLGEVVTIQEEEVTVLPPIRTVLRYGKKGTAQTLPVQLSIRLTEVGTLELWCHSQQSPHRWQLQFDVRQGGEPPAKDTLPEGETLDTALVQEAQETIRRTFSRVGAEGGFPPEKLPKQLVATLDLGREKWSTALIRKLADACLECRNDRATTPQHEARWLNLLGFCLRPGFGDPLDEWRAKEVWKIFHAGPTHARQAQNRSEWWVFWRRVAGGLSAGQQLHFYQQVSTLLPTVERKKKSGKALAKLGSPQEELEIWMALANMERISADVKRDLGTMLLSRSKRLKNQELWALSRFGARVPFYGPLDRVVPKETVAEWIAALVSFQLDPTENLARALVNLARLTGDRERDIPQADRERLADYVAALPRGERFRDMLFQPYGTYAQQEQDWVFGEALPTGLILSE